MLKKWYFLPVLFLIIGCAPKKGYYLRNTAEIDQKVIISLGNFFEEQKTTKLELLYTYKVVKVGKNTHRRLKGELKPKYLNSRQLEVKIPAESTLFIHAQNPGFSNVIFRKMGGFDTLFHNDLKRWEGKLEGGFYFDLK